MKFTSDARDLAQVLAKMVKMVPKGRAALTVFLKMVATITGTVVFRMPHNGASVRADIPAYVETLGCVSLLPGPLSDLIGATASVGSAVTLEHAPAIQQLEVISGPIEQRLSTVLDDSSPGSEANVADGAEEIILSAAVLKL